MMKASARKVLRSSTRTTTNTMVSVISRTPSLSSGGLLLFLDAGILDRSCPVAEPAVAWSAMVGNGGAPAATCPDGTGADGGHTLIGSPGTGRFSSAIAHTHTSESTVSQQYF